MRLSSSFLWLASASLALVAPAGAAVASDPAVAFEVGLAKPVLLGGQKNRVHLRVSLTGRPAPATGARPEANVCMAIDRSGSMAGDKIENARRGALSALGQLRDTDIVSVVAYDNVVRVVVPATRAADRRAIEAGIQELTPGGGTALFAGVVKCAEELRKFQSRNRVNRIVLLSDGNANVGPSSPTELGTLGAELGAQGISVATVGLGLDYNEDLMAELAIRSDGSHTFVEHAHDLAKFLEDELGAITAVVARDVGVRVRCAPGAHPVRVLGRSADIVGQTVTTSFGKIYGRRQHFFMVELELDAAAATQAPKVMVTAAGDPRAVATVEITFRDLLGNRDVSLQRPVAVTFTTRASEVEARADPRIMSELALLNADLAAERAVALRDKGDFAAAQEVLQKNAVSLDAAEKQYQDKRLVGRVAKAKEQAKSLSPAPAAWKAQRKAYKQDISDDLLNGL